MSERALPTPTLVMISRSIRVSRRTVDAVILSFALPIMLMLIFVYLFGGAIDTGGGYVTYVVPGVILLCTGFASGQTAVAVAQDMGNGIIDRFTSMNVSARAILAGHVVASVLRNAIATTLVIGVALAIGFRPRAGLLEWLAAAGILLAFMLAITWLAAALGLAARTPESASGFSFFVTFLPYPSSAFVPVETMPSWLQGIASHQPITRTVEAVRGLLIGGPVASDAVAALAWCAGIALASVLASAVLFRRRIT